MGAHKRKDFLGSIEDRSKKSSVKYPASLLEDLRKTGEKTRQISKTGNGVSIDGSIDERNYGSIDDTIDGKTEETTVRYTVPYIEPSIETSDEPYIEPSNETSDEAYIESSIETSDEAYIESSNETSNEPYIVKTDKPSVPSIPVNSVLNRTELLLFRCLQQLNGRATTLANICEQIKMPLTTLRDALRRLLKKGMIRHYDGKVFHGRKRGFSAMTSAEKFLTTADTNEINLIIKGLDFDRMALVRNPDPYIETSDEPYIETSIPYSSSSSLYKEPATPPGPSADSAPDIETVLKTDPEFGYWRQKGLTARQIKNWMQTAGCGPHSILEYLRYCRFDMLEEDTENTRPVENVFNWFFRILEKSGAYPRPKNYTSFTETQLENERRFAQEQEKQIKELRTLRQKKEQLKQDKAFEEMMNDPESGLYKKCLANLSTFHKKRAARKGKAFETAMRKEFEKISEAADN